MKRISFALPFYFDNYVKKIYESHIGNMTKEEAEKLLKEFNERYLSMKDWRQRIMKRAKD